ncbi:MAG: 3-hydroxybutyryl-CoA dehydrogenase [Spirochaetes bacterium]|jgi:3-hydroxybutyryl-CoA dehydrogenase|nr:3-hydroxybutyryl-CoA dehydrogenase [Spirochaetota bacterium]
MTIKTIGVIGAGQMGSGIAQVAAMAGFDVILNDIKDEFVQKGLIGITKFLSKSVEKGKLAADVKDAAIKRIKPSVDLKDMKNADFIIEAAIEREDLKFKLFQDLDSICGPDVILSTNTSSIPIGRIAAKTKRPDKVIGMHFFNPVPLMELVEVIRAITTSDSTFKTTWDLSIKMGKSPAQANDYAGFIANRILLPMINEAVFCLYDGVGSREDIDKVMKLGMNHPMGPLELADLIGLDTCLSVMETIYNGFQDSKYRPCPLLRKYVEAGWLGRKTGRGFYEYK